MFEHSRMLRRVHWWVFNDVLKYRSAAILNVKKSEKVPRSFYTSVTIYQSIRDNIIEEATSNYVLL